MQVNKTVTEIIKPESEAVEITAACAEDSAARTRLLFGAEALVQLDQSRVLIAGLGGVGGAVLEALARAGIGHLSIIDSDSFVPSNLNRQILSTTKTIGRPKVEAARERLKLINPALELEARELRLSPENIRPILAEKEYDLVIDCIDDLRAKAALVKTALDLGIEVLVAGGAGNRIRPEGLRVDYLENAFNDPLLKVLRRNLKDYPREKIRTVFSPHPPIKTKSRTIASSPYLPNILGFTLAGLAIEVILGLID
ncbi:MAG: ThiF family adenylyltransferase [Eubacteriales bacterium]|nr:ThiF family adenylyltransferase [Eubacteriales bacterium]